MKIEEEIKQSAFFNSAQKAIINIFFTHNYFQNEMRALFQQKDLTVQQYNVLRILRGKYPEYVNPGFIKSVMVDKNPDLTRLCDRLEKQGWISRENCPVNRRKVNIAITESGLELLSTLDEPEKDFFRKFKNISNEELEKLSELLDKVRG